MRSPMEAQSFYSVQWIKSILVGLSKSFDISLTFAFFSDTLFLKTGAGTWIRGERRTTTDTSIHLHTPTPGFENLHSLLNPDFQNLRKKQKASIDPWPQFHKLKLRRTIWSCLLGSAFPKPCSFRALRILRLAPHHT